jgi:hypothetical protein
MLVEASTEAIAVSSMARNNGWGDLLDRRAPVATVLGNKRRTREFINLDQPVTAANGGVRFWRQ